MPSRKPSSSLLESDRGDDQACDTESSRGPADALSLAEQAEAEAAEAEAVAAAARARARAIRLRQAADAELTRVKAEEPDKAKAESDDESNADEPADESAETDEPTGEQPPAQPRRRRLRRPSGKHAAAGVAVIGIAALISLSMAMVLEHRAAAQQLRLEAEYAAAARQGVVTLMSLNFNSAEEDVQRIIDNTTGEFRTDFEEQAGSFAQVAQESQVVTDVTVNATAVEAIADDTGVVLVAATSRVTNAAGAQQEPRSWRLSVSLARDGEQLKMSKVEFVP